MQALDLAIRNFAVAEHLLHLEELFAGAAAYQPADGFSLALCAELSLPAGAALHHVKNTRAVLGAQGSVPIPSCLTAPQGLDFLLRQAVVVACSALESFVWDILRENALTVIRARGRNAHESLKKITLTLDDYLSLEGYGDPDARLRQIILRRFERGSLYDLEKLDEIMGILNVKDFWKDVTAHTGFTDKEIRTRLTDLIQRRNQIAHRADRPDEGTPHEECDSHGLRPITHAWTSARIATAKAFVQATTASVTKALARLEQIIAQKEEQQLAQQTMQKMAAPSDESAISSSQSEVPATPPLAVGDHPFRKSPVKSLAEILGWKNSTDLVAPEAAPDSQANSPETP